MSNNTVILQTIHIDNLLLCMIVDTIKYKDEASKWWFMWICNTKKHNGHAGSKSLDKYFFKIKNKTLKIL